MTSQEKTLEEICERLSNLEKQNRRLKRSGAAALIVAASLALLGQTPARKTVEANEFILRDSDGRVRARLGTVSANPGASYPKAVQFQLFDPKGTERVDLSDGIGLVPSLSLYDLEGKERASLMEAFGQGGMLIFTDEKRNQTARVGPTDVKAGDVEATDSFALFDEGGNLRARLFMTARSTTEMTIPGSTEKVPVTAGPSPTLFFYDQKGELKAAFDDGDVAFYEPKGGDGLHSLFGHGFLALLGDSRNAGTFLTPYNLEVVDDQGFYAQLGIAALETPGTGETHKTSAASLVLFNKNKNVIWRAP
jgi:hypothetical protein